MRLLLIACAVCALTTTAFAGDYVHGYTRDNGTYVQPYYRSSPNSSTLDNYGSQGNVNPYTGQAGTVDPYAPSYNSNTLRGLGSGNDMLGRMR